MEEEKQRLREALTLAMNEWQRWYNCANSLSIRVNNPSDKQKWDQCAQVLKDTKP